MITEIFSRFRNLQIKVQIDPSILQNHLQNDSRFSNLQGNTISVNLNLYKLICAIGTIQTRRFAPSNRQKFCDKADLLKCLYHDNNFKVKINEIRLKLGSEVLGTISQELGIGISVLISDYLFGIEYSTISRILSNTKRPDWNCFTKGNKVLVVESKGSTSNSTINSMASNALMQKRTRNGDIKVASLSLLKENEISFNKFLDPPIKQNNMNYEEYRKILKAGHYASIFSFIGQSELSKYFSHMQKRLSGKISESEQVQKNIIFDKIRRKYYRIRESQKDFYGNFLRTSDNTFLYIGIDSRLINYYGFIDFQDYESEIDRIEDKNHYYITRDGIVFIEIRNIEKFKDIIDIRRIRHYQEFNTISDIDEMTGFSFEKYVVFLLNYNGFETLNEVKIGNKRVDIIAQKGNKKYIIELKLFRKKKINLQDIIEQLYSLKENSGFKVVLITNAIIDEKFADDELIIIDRNLLKQIVQKSYILSDYIK